MSGSVDKLTPVPREPDSQGPPEATPEQRRRRVIFAVLFGSLVVIAGVVIAISLIVAPTLRKTSAPHPSPPTDSEQLLISVRDKWGADHEAPITCAKTFPDRMLVLYGLAAVSNEGGTVFCRDWTTDQIYWRDQPSESEVASAFGDIDEFAPPFGAHRLVPVDLDGDSRFEIVAVSNHHREAPAIVTAFDKNGRLARYFHWGHLTGAQAVDLDRDGTEEALVFGTNQFRDYGRATLIVLDQERFAGTSQNDDPEAAHAVDEVSAARLVFPPFSKRAMREVNDSRLQFVRAATSASGFVADLAVNERVVEVEFDSSLNPKRATPSPEFTTMLAGWPKGARDDVTATFWEAWLSDVWRTAPTAATTR